MKAKDKRASGPAVGSGSAAKDKRVSGNTEKTAIEKPLSKYAAKRFLVLWKCHRCLLQVKSLVMPKGWQVIDYELTYRCNVCVADVAGGSPVNL